MTTKSAIRLACSQGLYMLPRHMHEGVLAHLEHGREVGGFLTALLDGDEDAFCRADQTNMAHEQEWKKFLRDHLPEICHGSKLKADAWRKMGGLDGYPDGQQ